MSEHKWWRLAITDEAGTTFNITGDTAVMHSAYEELKEAVRATDGVGSPFVEIHGVTDTVDRADCSLTINARRISGMYLTALYK